VFKVYKKVSWLIKEDDCCTWHKSCARLGVIGKTIEKFEIFWKKLTNLKFSSTSFHYIINFFLHLFPTTWSSKNYFTTRWKHTTGGGQKWCHIVLVSRGVHVWTSTMVTFPKILHNMVDYNTKNSIAKKIPFSNLYCAIPKYFCGKKMYVTMY
jgi:hypothetical protein